MPPVEKNVQESNRLQRVITCLKWELMSFRGLFSMYVTHTAKLHPVCTSQSPYFSNAMSDLIFRQELSALYVQALEPIEQTLPPLQKSSLKLLHSPQGGLPQSTCTCALSHVGPSHQDLEHRPRSTDYLNYFPDNASKP